jgi:hypothetical protein
MTNLYRGSIDMGGITIWAVAEKSESKAKSTSNAAGEGARSTLTPKQLGEIPRAGARFGMTIKEE